MKTIYSAITAPTHIKENNPHVRELFNLYAGKSIAIERDPNNSPFINLVQDDPVLTSLIKATKEAGFTVDVVDFSAPGPTIRPISYEQKARIFLDFGYKPDQNSDPDKLRILDLALVEELPKWKRLLQRIVPITTPETWEIFFDA